ncbi:galactokinase [Persicitalea jodogahamensis]|uniref:Galactokinase n=1 Tax=Persicitalea jodogahamensis TaxID=402147 RepID=A0A8J3G7X8_9BACT|nr:galactokinase [Persicitalea jodogahamensis]GHB60108.1 galactokinase [Persicitalea jodogahamensis]
MNPNPTADRIRDAFTKKYQQTHRLFRSPGRINLIGEHTDYNNGFVLPASVDKAVYFAIAPREDNLVQLEAVDLGETYEFQLDDLTRPEQQWPVYQLSVLDQLQKQGLKIKGFQASFGGDLPVGAGMSSSAALECCLLFALNELFGLGLDRLEIVKMAQRAENEYVGMKCGIMDQFASVFGKEQSVIQLDCRSLEYEYFPFPMEKYLLILCDTKVKHSLADSEYNLRRQECERGVEILQAHYPEVKSLRDATPAMVAEHKDEMGPTVYKRCKFMTEEIQRVQTACELLLKGDLAGFGEKMYDTHQGLQHGYEVSCPELDFLVDQTRSLGDVAGARMMGGGFGGCTINLVRRGGVENFEKLMKKAYQEKFDVELPCYRVSITDGTSEMTA